MQHKCGFDLLGQAGGQAGRQRIGIAAPSLSSHLVRPKRCQLAGARLPLQAVRSHQNRATRFCFNKIRKHLIHRIKIQQAA